MHNSIQTFSRGIECLGLKCFLGTENDREQERLSAATVANRGELPGLISELAILVGFTATCVEEGNGPAQWQANAEPPRGDGPGPNITAREETPFHTVTENLEKKGGGHMNNKMFDKKIHFGRLRMASRRVTALALAMVMCMGLYTPAMAANVGVWPVQAVTNVVDPSVDPAVSDGSGEAPTITIEVNGVIDQGRKLTGFVEVALRVKPGVLHLDADGNIVTSTLDPNYDHSETQPFSSLAVALEYSDKLTPWEWEKVDGNWNRLDETQAGNQTTAIDATSAIAGGFSTRKMVEIDPLHQSTRIAHAAISPKGTVTDGGTDGDGGELPPVITATGGGYLYLMSEGFTAKDFNDEDTVLAVVRFKYDLDETNDNNNPWGTMFAKGLNNPAVADWIDPDSPNCLVKLADVTVVQEPIDPIIEWGELVYDSGKSATRPRGNRFYYTTDTTSDDALEAYDPSKPESDPDFVSTTSNCMEVALVDTTAATLSTTTVVPGKINYTLVNKLSYNFSSGDSAVILYYDWDDRHIGTQILDPGDAREAVNQYVEENFIHPDLRYSAHKDDANAADYTDSLLRENTYRGEYPYDAPVAIPDVTSATYEDDLAAYNTAISSKVAEDGASYPLTNKLDYVFFKRYTDVAQTVTDPDGIPDSGDETTTIARTLVDPDGVGGSGDEYYHIDSYDAKLLGGLTSADVEEPSLLELPYIYGWAVVDDLDGISDVWTTLGTAEHTPYSGMDGSMQAVDTAVNVTYGGTSECLQFADFSNLRKGQVVQVKAVYEPGPELRVNGFYTAITPPAYERQGNTATPSGGVYGISFSYARVNASGQGVDRMRDPSVRIDYVPDVEGESQKPFSIGIDVKSQDIISVIYTPSSALRSLQYSLRDKRVYSTQRATQPVIAEYTSYTGSDRSQHSNLYNIDFNFNYTEHPYSQHLGSMGFVTRATFNQMDRLFREMAQTGISADIIAYVDTYMAVDLNLKTQDLDGNGTPVDYETWQVDELRAKLLDAYRIAGDAELDWHQIQYHIWNTTYDWTDWKVAGCVTGSGLTNSGGVISPAASTLAYNWCRIDNCSGGSSPINSFPDLMKAAADYVYTPNTNAFNQLQDVFYLRKGITAEPFADKDAMKAVLITVVTGLQTNGFTQTQVENLSWRQVQYLMDLVNDGTGIGGITPSNLPVNSDIAPTGSTQKDYWWENGGTKTISTWQELLEIQYHIINDNYFAGNTTTGWRSGYTNASTALTGSVRDKDSSGNWITPTGPGDPNAFTTKSVALRKNGTGDNFDTIAQFDAALNTAISTLGTVYTGGSFTNITLMEIQHALLGNTYETEATLMGYTDAGSINYWWITGASTPKNLKELVTLVKQVVDGAPIDLLDNVTVALVSGAPFWLRADSAGTVFSDDSTLHGTLWYAVDEWCKAGNNPATAPWPDATGTNWWDTTPANTRQVWSQLQNLLLWNSYNGDPDPGPNYAYWWYGNGHKPITNLEELLEAAWNTWGNNGSAPSDSSDPDAMDVLDDANPNDLKFITGVLSTDTNFVLDDLDFRMNDDGDAFGSVAAFKTQLQSFIQAATVYGGKPFILSHKDHWKVVQYYLINGVYQFDYVVEPDTSINYWWEDGGAKPTGPVVDYTWANSSIGAVTSAASMDWWNFMSLTGAQIKDKMTDTMVRAWNLCDNLGNPLTRDQVADKIAAAVDEYSQAMIAGTAGTGSDPWDGYLNLGFLELPWAALQHYIITGVRANVTPSTMTSVTWTPSNDITGGIDYTQADAWVAAMTAKASTVFWTNFTVFGSDIQADITATAAEDLDLRKSGVQLSDTDLANEIANAVNTYFNDLMMAQTSDWDVPPYFDGMNLNLDWKSLQNFILTGQKEALINKTFEEMKGTYNVDWYPPNDPVVPGGYSLRAPMKVQAMRPAEIIETEETTSVVTSSDGSRTITMKLKTKVDPNTGLTEEREERIEERRRADGSLETTTDITITVKDTATGEVVSREVELGTPVITDAADLGMSETLNPDENKDPQTPADPDKGSDVGADTIRPEEPADPDKSSDKTEEPTDPDKGSDVGGGVPDAPQTPADPDKSPDETEEPADPDKGSDVGGGIPDAPQTPADPDKGSDVGADSVRPQTPADPDKGSDVGADTIRPEEPTDPDKGSDVGGGVPDAPQTPADPSDRVGKTDTSDAADQVDSDTAADPPPVGIVRQRVPIQRFYRSLTLPQAVPLYAGPPNTRLRPSNAVLISILNHNILTTGRTLL